MSERAIRSSQLTPACLDEWLADADHFRVDFLSFCYPIVKALGYYFEFDQAALHAAHADWKSRCETWEKSYIMPDSDGLSHLKIMAILLDKLTTVPWLTVAYDRDSSADGFEFNGSELQREECRKDFNAGREAYLGFQFVIQVLNWFERARIDRKPPFAYRMTHDLEHDFMVYLLSERREEMAIFLFFKALYVRD
jgi:hypothetical protein